MNRYQRCLSRSLIFLTSFMIIFLLIIETNIGFQWIFRITNYFFLGLKTEKILGNWRDFTLQNVHFHLINSSIKASSVRFLINTQSFLNFSHIIKEIDVKNLIVLVHQNTSIFLKKRKKNNILQNNIIFMRHFVVDKIKFDRILLTTASKNILFLHISSGIKIDSNHLTILPTHINDISIFFQSFKSYDDLRYKKKIIESITSLNNYNIANFYSLFMKDFFSLNINLKILKCKHVNYFDNNKIINISDLLLQAHIKDNLVKIKKIQAHLNSFLFRAYGTVILNKNSSFSYAIKSQLFIKNFRNKVLSIFLTGLLDNRFSFNIKFDNLFNMNIRGMISLNKLYYPFYMTCDGSDIHVPIYKNILFNIDILHVILQGNLKNYYFSLKNTISINESSSIYSEIQGHSDVKNIFMDKINIFRMKKNIFYKTMNKIPVEKLENISSFLMNNSIYESQWLGHLNVLGNHNRNSSNFFVPDINIQGKIMQKKISILGSLYYKNFNIFETSGINFFLGKNKLFLKGILSGKYNIDSFFNAYHLDDFSPDLKGKITGKIHISNMSLSPFFSGRVLGKDLKLNNTHLKSIKIISNIHHNNPSVNYFFVDIKNFSSVLLNIHSLYIKSELKNNKKQNFDFLFKNKYISMNMILNNFFDKKTGCWHSVFKKIHVHTILGNWSCFQFPILHYIFDKNVKKYHYDKIKNTLPSILYLIKKKVLKVSETKIFNLKYELSFDTQLKWVLGHLLYNGQGLLSSQNISLEKKTKKNNLIDTIQLLKLHIIFNNDNINMHWFVKYLNDRVQTSLLSGAMHIKKVGDAQRIDSYCRIFRIPLSIIKYFMTEHPDVKEGTMTGHFRISGNIWNPQIFSDVNVYRVMIRTNNLFKYISFCFHSFFKKMEYIKTNQVIYIKKGHVFLILDCNFHTFDIEWNLFFKSHDMTISFFPYISFQFFPNVQVHFLSSKYDLIGNIKFLFFVLNIDEKNIIF